MIKQALILSVVYALLAGPSHVMATTLPAGTPLSVKTEQMISSHERRGRPFKASLDHNITNKGKILVRGGTPVIGVVAASRAELTNSSPLKLDLQSIVINGRKIPVKTNGPIEARPPALNARQAHFGHTVGEFTFSTGMVL